MIDSIQMSINKMYLAVIKQAARDIAYQDCEKECVESAFIFFNEQSLWDTSSAVDTLITDFVKADNYLGLFDYLKRIV